MVCHSTAMVGKEKNIGKQILKLFVYTSLGVGLSSVIYRENTRMYLRCMGKSEWFVFDLQNPFLLFVGGAGIKLKFLNPFRLSVNIVLYAFILVVPILYYKIFRQEQDTSIEGM